MRLLTPQRRTRSAGDGAGESGPAGDGSPAHGSPLGPRRRRPASRTRVASIFQRRRRPSPALRRFVALVLLVASLAMLTVSYREGAGGALYAPQMQVLHAVAPIERGLDRAWRPVRGAWDWGATLLRARKENPELRERVDQLEREAAIAQVVEQENVRLRELLALKERGRFPDGYRLVTGNVIARPPTSSERSLLIDLGSDDGVSVDDTVMVARGLIGHVEAVSTNAARVKLMIGRSEAVSATVAESGAQGVLRPVSNEGSPVMELAYVSQRVRVTPGDLVVTSGWSTDNLQSIYPAGVPLGVVSSVGNSPANLYKTIQVTPFADFDRIEEVIVLVARPGVRRAGSITVPGNEGVVTVERPTARHGKRRAGKGQR